MSGFVHRHKPALIIGGFTLFVVLYGGFLARMSASYVAKPITVTEHTQINECVELISVLDPNTNERYFVAADKCGHSVAITKRF